MVHADESVMGVCQGKGGRARGEGGEGVAGTGEGGRRHHYHNIGYPVRRAEMARGIWKSGIWVYRECTRRFGGRYAPWKCRRRGERSIQALLEDSSTKVRSAAEIHGR